MELLTVIKYPASRGCGGARPNPSIKAACRQVQLRNDDTSTTDLLDSRQDRRSQLCGKADPLFTVCTTRAPRVLHFSAVHYR